MKGSLTATSSTSSLWRATLATKRPILPNPVTFQLKLNLKKKGKRNGGKSVEVIWRKRREKKGGRWVTVDSDLDLAWSTQFIGKEEENETERRKQWEIEKSWKWREEKKWREECAYPWLVKSEIIGREKWEKLRNEQSMSGVMKWVSEVGF